MKPSRIAVAALAVAACFVVANPPPEDQRAAGEEALKDRDWAKAETLLTQALGTATERQDEILHLISVAQQNAGKHDAAIASLDRLVKDYPASSLRMKALYRKGDVLAAKKEFALAAQIYDAQVAVVTAPERRKRIAMVYVDAGREFLKPKDAKDPTFAANWHAARNLLVKALELEALGADEEGVRADVIECELKSGLDRSVLLKSCRDFEEKFPQSARKDDVLFAKGTALRDLGRPFDARAAWTKIADAKKAPEALYLAALLFVNEQGASANLEELRRALPLLRRVAKEFAGSEWGPKAGYLAGLALAHFDEMRDEARAELTAFAAAFAKDERAPEALLRVALLHRADFDDAKAIATLEDFLKRFPDSPRWPDVRQMIADVRFDGAQRAFLRKDWAAGRQAASEFTTLHPTDPRAPLMAYRVGEALKEEKKFKEAVEAWMKTATKYPGHDEGHHARLSAGELMAKELDDFEAALKELPKVGGSWAGQAQQLVQTLQGKALALKSEHVFHSGETPAVKLTVRNVETVKLRFWSLDLKDYFEKKASTSGLEALEVSIIAPDKEWEVPVKDFRRFKEMTLDVELPKKDPGAYVVAASAGALESKTVVVVSDLSMIARAGRKGAMVMVENMRTGERVETAQVRVAADGKHLKAWTPETTASRLSFLVEREGHLAFRDMDVSRLPVPSERAPRAVIVADRGVYGEEDEVQVRVVVRDAVEGVFGVPKDKKYKLTAANRNGVVFHEAELALSKAGTAGGSFRLLRGVGGQVRIQVVELARPQEKVVGEGWVQVGPQAGRQAWFDWLTDDTPRWVGEDVDVVGVLRDAWNRPMPGRRVQVLAPSDLDWRDVVTGADGTFAVSLRETDRFFRDGVATVSVRHESVHGFLAVPFLLRRPAIEFDAASRVTEPVPAGDAKTIEFTAKKADDTPAPGAYKWTVVRTTVAGERIAVASGDVQAGADGKGRFQFTPRDGGLHTIAVLQRDSDGIPARAQTAVQVVDDKEDRKLRLLSAADEFEPGKPMEFTILSRLDKGLAFVTVEGEKIEQTVAVTADKGRTTVKLAAPPAGTRDFTVTVMMMQSHGFHADARAFRLKGAEMKVEPEKKEYRPGEEAVIKVTAAPGTEVVLHASRTPARAFHANVFLPDRAGDYFTGDSSATTEFAWGTTQLDPALLEALARLEELNKDGTSVMLERDLAVLKDKDREKDANEDEEGMGGGGGHGGRFGGRKNLTARGAGKEGRRIEAEPAPLAFATAEADAQGVATFRFRMPDEKAEVFVSAWAADASNRIATATAEVKSRAPVLAEFRAPETAVEGEKTSVVVLLTNVSAQEREATLSFGGADVKVKVPARSTAERTLEWTAAAKAEIAIDGIRRTAEVDLRAKAPTTYNELGGAFAAGATLKVEGQGPMRVRVATGPVTFLESLAEGRDPLRPGSDAAARLVARIARHRLEKSDRTKMFVREFEAQRAAGLADATPLDAATFALHYLAAAEAEAAEFDIALDPAPIKGRFARATTDDVKALLLFALARGGQADFGYVHRLWRGADALSPRSLACVALAMKALGKNDEAKAAIERLAKAVKTDHWDASPGAEADSAATTYAATALAAFALAEIDPANALLTKSRSWLLSRRPSSAFERAILALAMQSVPEKSQVTAVRVDGQEVKGFGEVTATQGVVDAVGAGTYFALAWRETGTAPEPVVKTTVKRTALWPVLVVEGQSALPRQATVKEPVENPSMAKVAAGNAFAITYEIAVAGPTTQYAVLELPRATGLRDQGSAHRVLLPPQQEAERKFTVVMSVYADAPGSYPDIEVLAAGAEFRQDWKITHGERLAAGAILYEKKKWKETRDVLAPLFESGTLVDAAQIDAARILAYASVELQEHAAVVKYFEILKEKAPAEVVPFDKIRAVARAYAAQGEHERAMQVHSGASDAYFLQEANLSGALEDLGRMKDSVVWMKTLLLDYPDSALNRDMLFGFGQRLYAKGKSHRDPAEKDPKALTRSELLAEAAGAFERWHAWHPAAEDGDRVMLSLLSTYLESSRFDVAESAARSAATRFPKSRFLDTFDYTLAMSHFAQKEFAEALVLCDRLESHDYGEKANPGPEVIRLQAVLMKAQIFHAKGELDKALENYKKVKDKSDDARRSIAFLEREALALPELTLAPLAKAAELELEYAGVPDAHVRAYKVDLTMLALRRRSLADAASIEVAGIRPVFEKTIALDHPNARRRERQKFTLDLKEPGAYVVGVKAGDFFASGLLLRSNLSMTVQEQAEGVVRVNVSDVAAGGFAEGVKVTIFGTSDNRIASEKTDLRGIWETSGVRGLAVVVAEKDGHVAMYKGQSAIGHERQPQKKPAQDLRKAEEAQKELLDQEMQEANEQMEDAYNRNLRNKQQGVEVERTKK